MSDNVKENLSSSDTWTRILYIILFVIFYSLAEVIISAVVVFQLILVLFTAQKNERLLKLGQSLSTYVYQVMCYLTFNSDHKPYPFGAWPKGEPSVSKKSKEVSAEEKEA